MCYGAVHLEATYIVHQIRKVKFSQISYPFSRNALFHARNISSEAILLNVKIDGDKFYIFSNLAYIAVHAYGLFPKMVHISTIV